MPLVWSPCSQPPHPPTGIAPQSLSGYEERVVMRDFMPPRSQRPSKAGCCATRTPCRFYGQALRLTSTSLSTAFRTPIHADNYATLTCSAKYRLIKLRDELRWYLDPDIFKRQIIRPLLAVWHPRRVPVESQQYRSKGSKGVCDGRT